MGCVPDRVRMASGAAGACWPTGFLPSGHLRSAPLPGAACWVGLLNRKVFCRYGTFGSDIGGNASQKVMMLRTPRWLPARAGFSNNGRPRADACRAAFGLTFQQVQKYEKGANRMGSDCSTRLAS